MPDGKLHDDEVAADADLVRRLLRAQHPQWADLPISAVDSTGTSNYLFRLGDDLAVRLPRVERSTAEVDVGAQWLPVLAPQLPLAIPVPVAPGVPGEGYPFTWSVQTWLDGASADTTPVADLTAAATALAGFVRVLRAIDPTGGRTYDGANYYRGCPLAFRDPDTRRAIAELDGRIDTDAATQAWEHALGTPPWTAPGVWIHGDLMPGNLLFTDGRLTGVIDFGGVGVGDPACDVQPAWNLLDADARVAYRTALEVDDATWARGRGWALSVVLLQLPYYWDSNPGMARVARTTIDAVLDEFARDR